MDIARLQEKLEDIPDPRRQWGNIRHKLEDILVIGLVTLLCNGSDYEDMEAFGREREAELRKFLELPEGIPDESTFLRVFQRVKPQALSACLYSWLTEEREMRWGSVNIDGKTIRGSGKGGENGVHVVSAWAGEEEIVLGQLSVDKKSNEITAIPKLLELFDVRGTTITIDAMGCQTEIAKKIREKQGNYILAVKDNQPTLHQDIREYFEGLEQGDIRDLPDDVWQTGEERGHGRVEKREVRSVTDIQWLAGKPHWKDLKTIIQYRCWRDGVVTDRYYISNADMSALEFYRYIRGHWSIENRLHWSLDMIFREDAAQVGKDHAPENLNILRKMALSLLRAAEDPRFMGKKKMSGPKKRFVASMNPNYMFSVLFGEK
jgi:predicted transposase YbfD/YdcC